MAHSLFGNRFLSARCPAWHGLGIVHQDPINARESLKIIGGQPTVTLEPLYTEIGERKIELPQRSILRHPTDDDPEYIHFGIVGSRYELLTLKDVANIWDAVVGKPIETMGFLHRGANAFLTSKLPAIDVKGDEVERYILLTTPLDGIRMATAEEVDVRVVCQNTLRAAQAQAISTCRVIHDKEAKGRIARWLKEAYAQAEANVTVVREAYELLATTKMTTATVSQILTYAYPDARLNLDDSLSTKVMTRRYELAEAHNKRMQKYREAALDLFEGDGTGMDTPAARGTAWGCVQAVTELEDYRRGTNRGGRSEAAQVAEATMWGNRAAAKQRCFEVCLAIAQDDDLEPYRIKVVPLGGVEVDWRVLN